MKKYLFLDVDGVLNPHKPHPVSGSLIYPEMMGRLNNILSSTQAKLCISSSWRYMVYGGSMSVIGLCNMLRSHGLQLKEISITPSDEEMPATRGEQIQYFLYNERLVRKYVVLDDMDMGISKMHPFIHTDGTIGLTDEHVHQAIGILNSPVES